MTRHRLEDLGRIAEKMRMFYESERLDDMRPVRPKDFADHIESMEAGLRRDFIHRLGYDIEAVSSLFHECLCIAEGRDELSEDCGSKI